MIMQYNYKINKKIFLLIFLINLKIKRKLKQKNNQNLISKFKIVLINQTKLFNKVKYKKER